MTVLLYTRPRYRHVAIPTDELEEMLDDKVNLQIWVKVRPDWQDNDTYLQNIKSKI